MNGGYDVVVGNLRLFLTCSQFLEFKIRKNEPSFQSMKGEAFALIFILSGGISSNSLIFPTSASSRFLTPLTVTNVFAD